MTSGPSGDSPISTTDQCPQHNAECDHEKRDHNNDIGAIRVLLAKRIESHGTGA